MTTWEYSPLLDRPLVALSSDISATFSFCYANIFFPHDKSSDWRKILVWERLHGLRIYWNGKTNWTSGKSRLFNACRAHTVNLHAIYIYIYIQLVGKIILNSWQQISTPVLSSSKLQRNTESLKMFSEKPEAIVIFLILDAISNYLTVYNFAQLA